MLVKNSPYSFRASPEMVRSAFIRFSDSFLTRTGFVIIALGIAAVLLPLGDALALAGLVLVGLLY